MRKEMLEAGTAAEQRAAEQFEADIEELVSYLRANRRMLMFLSDNKSALPFLSHLYEHRDTLTHLVSWWENPTPDDFEDAAEADRG